ncbi:uncharacterized protein LOC128239176 [Mya arenaria]|uniref:uncharacterized protein LOC128239176 n=1 Tax=Mya arenaria TaxID=6604 RepID=UPI0022DF2B1A|nr:uncharacterized protein LOC128239176 [Mya arenaria]
MKVEVYCLCPLLWILLAVDVSGHGRLLVPPGRSSAWRERFPVPPNYDDNGLNCGGRGYQFSVLANGRCGVCGDRFEGPFNNEAGGIYAKGVIVRNYAQEQIIRVTIEITINHGGYSEFRLCPNNDVTKRVTQQCLDKYLLAMPSGQTRYIHPQKGSLYGNGRKDIDLVLPRGLTCTQCVLQWKWTTNSNNNCGFYQPECCNVTNVGCGDQEHFLACSDVSVGPGSSKPVTFTPAPYVHTVTTRAPVVTSRTPPPSWTIPGGFVPIGLGGAPPQNKPPCEATALGRSMYGQVNADRMCSQQCHRNQGGPCPVTMCADSCRDRK